MAWDRTWEVLGGTVPLMIAAAVFIVTLVIVHFVRGKEHLRDLLISAQITLVASVLIGAAVFAVYLFIVAPIRAKTESDYQIKKLGDEIYTKDAMLKEAAGSLSKAMARAESLEADNQLLRDKLADARNAKPIEIRAGTNVQLAPQIEGMRHSVKQVPSIDPTMPFTLEITIQVDSEISPFGVFVVCDKPITGRGGLWNFTGMMAVVGEGPMERASERGKPIPETYGFKFSSPAMTPRIPLVLTVSSKESFNIIQVNRW
jgi:hypothetical protein